MATRIVYVVFSVCLCIGYISSDNDHGEAVVSYTEEAFEQNIVKNKHFVMFYAPWCGHCKRIAPTWNELAKIYNVDSEERQVVIAKVDCTEETKLCADQDVTGYPTLKFFRESATDFLRYRGYRELDALKAFVEEQFGKVEDEPKPPEPQKALVELTEATFTEHIKHGQHFIKFYAPWCGHCQRLAPTWEQLAQDFQNNEAVTIAKVDCTANGPVCDAFNVKGYPTLLWIKDGQTIEKYQEGRDIKSLTEFVSRLLEHVDPEQHRTDEMIVEGSQEPQSQVIDIAAEDFDEAIGSGLVFVKFFAPWCGHCKRLAPTWEELSTKFVDVADVHIAKVDCDMHRALCSKHEIRGYPTLILYNNGIKIQEYNGGRDIESLSEFVKENVARKDEL